MAKVTNEIQTLYLFTVFILSVILIQSTFCYILLMKNVVNVLPQSNNVSGNTTYMLLNIHNYSVRVYSIKLSSDVQYMGK